MISGKINLGALKHVKMEQKGKSGMVQGIFIPFDVNKIHVGEKGIYLDIVAFENKTPNDYSTHMVKQSFSKEVREKMTQEEKTSQPILGSLKTTPMQTEANGDANDGKVVSPDDDLPF